MTKRHLMLRAALVGSLALAGAARAAEPEKVWEVPGLSGPESAVLDPDAGVLYVSNINGGPTDVDGNGYISTLSPKGELVEQEWVSGLDGPKGLALHGGKLYVADITRLHVIDTATAEVVASHDAPGSSFLNDVSAHEDGRVFVSDMFENQIWLLDGDTLVLWLEDDALEGPNGLHAEGDRLVVAAWGVPKEDFSTEVPGHLKAVDLASKEISSLGDGAPVGNLDGLEPDGRGGYLVTDWIDGGLYRFDADGKAVLLMDLNQGSANLEFIEGEKLAIIPMMMDGTVAAYRVE